MIKKILFFSCVFIFFMKAAQCQVQPADDPRMFSGLPLKENIYVHSDKNFYLAGEILWFKLYCVEGKNAPVNISKVAYVEILDRNNKAVLQAKINLDMNGGNGSFYLPLTLASDYYILRAYTNWMKNGGTMVFFEKTISIVNTVKVNAPNSSADSIRAHADFFPEGGQMVEGIETTVAFRITGSDNKGTDARGIVVDNSGDTVAQFSPKRFGIGRFRFRPEKGRTYSAIVLLPAGKFIQQALPIAQPYGYVMNVSEEDKEKLKVTVLAKGQPGHAGEKLALFVGSNGSLQFFREENISYDRELVIYIERSKLSQGVSYLTLLNGEQQPVCERLVFNGPLSSLPAEISSNKNVYGIRQAVDISVLLKGKGGEMVNGSVSVYEDDSLQGTDDRNITVYFSLFAELKGQVESPAYYFSNDPGVNEAVDNLLLTHGWRRFRQVEQVNKDVLAPSRFMPEENGHVISGRVINVKNGNAVADADCSLSIPSIPFGFYVAQSDSTGIVRFEVPAYYGTGEIIAQVDAPNKNDYRIDFYNPFSDDPCFTLLSPFSLTPEKERRLLQKSIAMQAQNIYTPDSIRQFRLPDLPDTLPFYGRAEYHYWLDNYKRFTTMEEVLREYVTPINVQLRNNKLSLSIFDETTREVYHENILLLLDNVPIRDYNKIFSFDPLKIKKLEVVPRHYIYRSRYFSGIASFETYDGKFNGFELDPALVAVDYEGLQLQREFYSPRYSDSGQDRIPDLRTTLYWDPQVNIRGPEKTSRRFYTSDQKGNYVIVLQGISEKGQPVFATASFRVE